MGEIGYIWAETEGYLGSIAGPVESDTNENELLLGMGFSYELTDNFDIRLEYNESDHFNWTWIGLNFGF